MLKRIVAGSGEVTESMVDVRGRQVFAASATDGRETGIPLFEIRGNQVFRSPWHPEGASRYPVYEIRGSVMFTSPLAALE